MLYSWLPVVQDFMDSCKHITDVLVAVGFATSILPSYSNINEDDTRFCGRLVEAGRSFEEGCAGRRGPRAQEPSRGADLGPKLPCTIGAATFTSGTP